MLSFSVGKTKIYISFSFTVCITLLALLDKSGLLFISFIAVFLHEIGHYIALKTLGIKSIEVSFVLAAIKLNIQEYIDNKRLAIIAGAGPLFNLLLSGVIFIDNYYLKYFGAANFLLFIFNMLPVYNLDGGDVLRFFLCSIFKENGEKIFKYVSIIVITTFFVPIGVLFMLKFSNPTILLVGIYLIIMSFKKV